MPTAHLFNLQAPPVVGGQRSGVGAPNAGYNERQVTRWAAADQSRELRIGLGRIRYEGHVQWPRQLRRPALQQQARQASHSTCADHCSAAAS